MEPLQAFGRIAPDPQVTGSGGQKGMEIMRHKPFGRSPGLPRAAGPAVKLAILRADPNGAVSVLKHCRRHGGRMIGLERSHAHRFAVFAVMGQLEFRTDPDASIAGAAKETVVAAQAKQGFETTIAKDADAVAL